MKQYFPCHPFIQYFNNLSFSSSFIIRFCTSLSSYSFSPCCKKETLWWLCAKWCFERQQTIQIKQPWTRELNICIQRRHYETFSWNSCKVPPAPLDQFFHSIVWSFLSSSQGLFYVSFFLNCFKCSNTFTCIRNVFFSFCVPVRFH